MLANLCSAEREPERNEEGRSGDVSEQLTAYDGLLPTGVAVADSRVGLNVPLFLEEEERASSMVVSRRADFVTVRACARLALGRLGVPPVPLVPGEAGEPSWPNGIVGSMTHCRGLRAAAVAFAHDADAIGIDAEPDEPLPDGVIDIVASPAERRRLRALPVGGVSWDRLLFSAKESVYKAWYPRERSWLGFEDADVALGDGVLTAEIHGESGLRFTLTGYWGVSDGILVTAVVVPAGKWPAGT